MRRSFASLLLLVLVAAMFAPLAHASLGKPAHACCVRRHHGGGKAASSSAPAESSRHACCTLALERVAAPAAPPLAARPAAAHPVIEEFYPALESQDALARESERAPPARQ